MSAKIRQLCLFEILLMLLLPVKCCPAIEIPAPPASAIWVSTPDNQWVSTKQSLDSKTTIEAAFDMWQKVFNVRRVYWRGSQVALWLENNNYLIRDENYAVSRGVAVWWRHLIEDAGVNRMATQQAHTRGMEIWMNDGLFEHGCGGEDLGFPGHVEDRIRIEHPEWIPVDRYGLRRQGGTVEFAYPEARAILVKRYTDHCVRHGYDGIMFYTYVENFSMRYQDEFGFNEPIVAEYKNRYGKDIRTEPFDKTLWAKLRGEYVTVFLRELKAELARYNKGLGVMIYRRYDNGHYPAKWLACPGSPEISLAGRIRLDWEQWAKEGVVDDMIFYAGTEDANFMEYVFDVTKDTPCLVHFSTANIWDDADKTYIENGAHPCFFSTEISQYGYTMDLPKEAFYSSDPYQRLRILYQSICLQVKPDTTDLEKLTRDENVYVRRAALQALGALKAEDSVSAVEACLQDSENSVRCAAVSALGSVQGPESLRKIFDTLRSNGNFLLSNNAIDAIGCYLPAWFDDIARCAKDENFWLRRTCVEALANYARAECEEILLDRMLRDSDDWIRKVAMDGLAKIKNKHVMDAFLACSESDKSQDIQRRAMEHACLMCSNDKNDEFKEYYDKCLFMAVRMFRQYGDESSRTDDGWGWRPLGNAILEGFGEKGKAELYECWKSSSDRAVSERAFKVLFFRQSPMSLNLTTEQEALTLYRTAMLEKEMWPWHNPNRLRRK